MFPLTDDIRHFAYYHSGFQCHINETWSKKDFHLKLYYLRSSSIFCRWRLRHIAWIYSSVELRLPWRPPRSGGNVPSPRHHVWRVSQDRWPGHASYGDGHWPWERKPSIKILHWKLLQTVGMWHSSGIHFIYNDIFIPVKMYLHMVVLCLTESDDLKEFILLTTCPSVSISVCIC